MSNKTRQDTFVETAEKKGLRNLWYARAVGTGIIGNAKNNANTKNHDGLFNTINFLIN